MSACEIMSHTARMEGVAAGVFALLSVLILVLVAVRYR